MSFPPSPHHPLSRLRASNRWLARNRLTVLQRTCAPFNNLQAALGTLLPVSSLGCT
ncbi:hypothetical protein FAES_5208 [Fibrella aestuarina BUZ 2]|uniref:Uncharacterized protein n=1 Tax=Fibrella aestuarina BUZ 2 TaxID=1166018 RepID=I0KGF4_9BACT|nr:hypothetical protein FAES_5208 [Fibrella aestuarina BUZ 2]